MKTKRLLSLLLCFVMLCGIFTPSAIADVAVTTVYVTLSGHGEILTGANGEYLACVPVAIDEQTPNLDTVLRQFHALYHENGEEAYSSYEGDYGTAIGKLWEDESELFGYQVNGGTESVYGLSHTVKNGDFVDVCIYQNKYPDTESYTVFDTYTVKTETGCEVTLTLTQAGYDENWNMVFFPCADAEITIDGENTGCITDENGQITLSFEEEKQYVVSATKKKTLQDREVTEICAPVCVVNADNTAENLLHTLAGKYSSDEIMSDGNMYWFAADIADYGKIYPDTGYVLSEEIKQLTADNIIDMCTASSKPGDLAKGIIALRSMGYDASKAYTSEREQLNIAKKLNDLIQTNFEDVSNVYTLPYVIMALNSGEGYATAETMDFLVNYACENCDEWLITEYGTDALSPMLTALAPFRHTNPNAEEAIAKGVEVLENSINENGMIGNAPSTALAIAGLCSVGINPTSVTDKKINLIAGLLTHTNDTNDGFIPVENTFATEQGMRALNGYMLFKNGDRIYNFCEFPAEEIHHTLTPFATVVFETDPKSATVTVDKKEAEDNTFFLKAGKYTYKVSKSGYKTEEKDFTISEEDAENFETITFTVELTKKSSGGGGGGGGYYVKSDKETPKENPKEENNKQITFPDIEGCSQKDAILALAQKGVITGTDQGLFLPGSTVTRAEFTTMITKALSLKAQNKASFDDVASGDWFFEYVNAAYENGIVSGTGNNTFNPYGTITNEEVCTMLARAAKLYGKDTGISDEQAKIILCQFSDYTTISSWATQAMAYCCQNGIFDIFNINCAPQKAVSRAEIAQMLWNLVK